MEFMAFHEWMDQRQLQNLQHIFCDITGVSVLCLDDQKKLIAASYGKPEDVEILADFANNSQIQALLERTQAGSLEEQITEKWESGPGIVAAISVRTPDSVFCYFIVFQSEISDEKNPHFDRVLDCLREGSRVLLDSRLGQENAQAQSRRSFMEQQRIEGNLQDITATTEIVQLLDSDETIEQIMSKWLDIIGSHIQVDTAQIFQLYPESETMDVMAQYCGKSCVSYFTSTSRIPIVPFLNVDKPLVITLDNARGQMEENMRKIGISALLLLPIINQDVGSILLSLVFRHKHVWQMEEIKFAADAVKIMHSILTRRIQKNSIASSLEIMETILDNLGCGIYVTKADSGKALFANRILQELFPDEYENPDFSTWLDQGRIPEEGTQFSEVSSVDGNHWYDVIYKDISWVDGSPAVLHSVYDITDKKQYQRRIEQQAYTDFLTGLYNRMRCERDLEYQIREAKYRHERGALLYLDLDDFKNINDVLGHQYGDVLLKAISHSLQRIKGIESTCYRMGGDEFVIVVPPVAYDKLQSIVEDIQHIFSKPWFLKDADYYCTMSMGIVTYPDHGDSVQDLIKKADIAMYAAKKAGKNRINEYSDGIGSISGKRLTMEKNMRDATVSGYKEFEVYYQPIMDIQGMEVKCAGAEALIRWNSTNLGFISPAEFIPLAEYLGLITPIGNYVLRQACKHCKGWNDNGYPDYKVNVNLSVVQLVQSDIVETIANALLESRLNPKNLTLEVTESLAINDMERMKEILNRIKALGVKIALDDFGTGYSSLNHIREIPFDLIKVDQNFVKDLTEDPFSQSFIKMVAELAETIGVMICVEGVEKKKQYDILQGMKVKYIQGYYFARPMPKEMFESKFALPIKKEEPPKNGN